MDDKRLTIDDIIKVLRHGERINLNPGMHTTKTIHRKEGDIILQLSDELALIMADVVESFKRGEIE